MEISTFLDSLIVPIMFETLNEDGHSVIFYDQGILTDQTNWKLLDSGVPYLDGLSRFEIFIDVDWSSGEPDISKAQQITAILLMSDHFDGELGDELIRQIYGQLFLYFLDHQSKMMHPLHIADALTDVDHVMVKYEGAAYIFPSVVDGTFLFEWA